MEVSNLFRWYSGSENELADVDLSTDGGSIWSNRLRIEGGSDGHPAPNTKSVDLSAVIGGVDDLRLRFHYHQAQYEWWWAIDNVRVRCTMLSCTPCAASVGPPGEPGLSAPLTVRRDSGNLVFEWGAPDPACQTVGYAIYKGDLRTLSSSGYSHGRALTCATGSTSFAIPETDLGIGPADYYLVVADNGVQEGSYGSDSGGLERAASPAACHEAQNLLGCGP